MTTTTATERLATLDERHRAERARLEREAAIEPLLPAPPCSIYAHHGAAASVQYERKTFAEALDLLRLFQADIVPAEHWQSGCLSVAPAELNRYRNDERAVMDGESFAELLFESWGSRGEYRRTGLLFFARRAGEWLHINITITAPPWGWMPQVTARWDCSGNCTSATVSAPFLGEDQRRKWWSSPPCYRLSYYWADAHNFFSWASSQKEENA